jgi:hypothetical protein
VLEECENCEACVLLENFWCKAIFRTQFALLLFLHDLMSSISSFVAKLSFVVKRPLVKKQVLITYSNCSQTFLKRTFCCEGDLVEKMQSWYLLCSSDFLWENPLG